MTPEQFEKLIEVLSRLSNSIADTHYTITGAADWPILLVCAGMFCGVIGGVWIDLKTTFKDKWKDEEIERKRQDDLLWAHARECKEDCCPQLRRETR